MSKVCETGAPRGGFSEGGMHGGRPCASGDVLGVQFPVGGPLTKLVLHVFGLPANAVLVGI